MRWIRVGVPRLLAHAIDFFYRPPFTRLMDRQTFRYAAVGGGNLLLGTVLYWVLFNFVLDKQDTDFGVVVVSAPILAFLINFVVTFCTGFWLTRTVAFTGSKLSGGRQLFRYAQVVAVNLVVSYLGLKLFVEVCGFFPTPSNLAIQIFTVGISYVASKHYTFR